MEDAETPSLPMREVFTAGWLKGYEDWTSVYIY